MQDEARVSCNDRVEFKPCDNCNILEDNFWNVTGISCGDLDDGGPKRLGGMDSQIL